MLNLFHIFPYSPHSNFVDLFIDFVHGSTQKVIIKNEPCAYE